MHKLSNNEYDKFVQNICFLKNSKFLKFSVKFSSSKDYKWNFYDCKLLIYKKIGFKYYFSNLIHY